MVLEIKELNYLLNILNIKIQDHDSIVVAAILRAGLLTFLNFLRKIKIVIHIKIITHITVPSPISKGVEVRMGEFKEGEGEGRVKLCNPLSGELALESNIHMDLFASNALNWLNNK
ncbi:hypothetical protein Glove_236g14 [Diversispora epigaea]|uniref:Uncharacterized protein n=1 Tax=Diversispora epigaea TaxID=1348612 RepID=A0A397IHN2_9GLOM|nr:hypothetical protein Glove_236g14 [Diversispora epigaea]